MRTLAKPQPRPVHSADYEVPTLQTSSYVVTLALDGLTNLTVYGRNSQQSDD